MNTQNLREYRRGLSPRARHKLLKQAMGEMSDSLQKIGFDDYGAYLQSNLWNTIRRRIFKRANGKCEACNVNNPANVHHWSYSVATLQGERPQHLEAVCRECHERFHKEFRDRERAAEQARLLIAEFHRFVAESAKQRAKAPRLVRRPA